MHLASILDSVDLWQFIVLGVVALIAWGCKALAKQSWAKDLEQKLFTSVEAASQRAKDKYLDALTAARDPGSDGGIVVTPREMSQARQIAFQYFVADGAKDVVAYGLQRGEDFVKGLIGKQLGWNLGGYVTLKSPDKPPANWSPSAPPSKS